MHFASVRDVVIQYTGCESQAARVLAVRLQGLLSSGSPPMSLHLTHAAGGAAIALTLCAAARPATAQSGPVWLPHVPFVETTPEVSQAMLTLAGVGPSDVVYDLGCGDGRIVIQAARAFGARGVGIDIDPQRIEEANRGARAAGVTDKVRFVQGDLLYADIHDATVIAMFLLPSVNARLRPKLFRDLRPGTRVVTHNFDIGDWSPQRRREVGGVPVYLWTIPETTRAAGHVRLEGGSPPPIPASIEKTCGTRVSFEAYSDALGDFVLALERSPGQSPGSAPPDWSGCRLTASLPGYSGDTVPLQAEAGTLILHRTAHSQGSLVSVSARQAPPAAQREFERGQVALARGQRDAARQYFTRGTEIYPAYAAAWFELGSLEESAGRLSESTEFYRMAVVLEPAYLSPYLGLIQVSMHADRWEEIAAWAEKIIALDPESFPDAYLYHAIGKLTMKDFAAAERSARAAMELDTAHQLPRAEYVLGLALAAQGNLSGARMHLERYIVSDPKAPDLEQIRQRLKLLRDPVAPASPAAH